MVRERLSDYRNGFDFLEPLEQRWLMSAEPNFADFSSTHGLVTKGFAGTDLTSNNALQLTDGQYHESRAVWWSKRVGVDQFTTSFSFNSNAGDSADGFTFTVQNSGTSKLGKDGGDLGYTNIGKSVAVAFNLYNKGAYGSQFGFAEKGKLPQTNTDMSPVDLHNGDTYNAVVTYDGTTLSVTVTDANDSSKTFTQSEQINIPKVIGSDSAFVGFTAATGQQLSTQDVTAWTYTGQSGPTLVNAAGVSSSRVFGTTTTLSALATDGDGDDQLTYDWTVITKPKGATTPTFAANGTNAAKSTKTQFYKAGHYVFLCTITNSAGQSVTTTASVVVVQTETSLRLTPHIRVVGRAQPLDFKAATYDQFGHPMETQPTMTYSLLQGDGTIDPNTGHFVAGKIDSHIMVQATGDGLTGMVGGTLEV